MPNDAKLGLVLGVGIVIVVAVVFFRKESSPGGPGDAPPAAVGDPSRPVKARPTALRKDADAEPQGRRHTVKDGDTLFSLAEEYYGDKERFLNIYQANRAALKSPDQLPAGTVLVIPEAAAP
jgi:nucleoid-associated protein YgaU